MFSESNDFEDRVVLVHGLAASKHVFWRLGRVLRRRDFATTNWGYWSIRGDIHKLGCSLAHQLRQIESDSATKRLHLVTHSMGSIIARSMLTENSFAKLQRIVMLAPPHRGSRIAGTLAPCLGSIFPPLRQLSHASTSVVNQLAEPVNAEIGIIAAARDRVVALDSTHLTTQADHTVVNYGHTSMLFRREVAELVLRFLDRGRFA